MRVGKAQAGARQAVEIGRFHACRAIAAQVAVADVIGIDENDIGLAPRACALRAAGATAAAPRVLMKSRLRIGSIESLLARRNVTRTIFVLTDGRI